MPAATYQDLVERRRSLRIPPYKTMADVGFDGPWVTPYQISSCAADGPALVALHWLDEPSIEEHRPVTLEHRYLVGERGSDDLHLLPTFMTAPDGELRPNPDAARSHHGTMAQERSCPARRSGRLLVVG